MIEANDNNSFKVSSSHGYLIVEKHSGVIIECISDGCKNDYLPEIERFDMDRFRASHKCDTIPKDIDILRLAYWSKNNKYETPADGYEPI